MPSQDTETKTPPSKSNIEFIVLPKKKYHTRWDEMIEKYKNFRLFALGESPEAFASKLAIEEAFSKDIWAGRLANLRATHVFAIHCPNVVNVTTDSGKFEALLNNEWIAQTVFVEIVDSEVAKLAADKSPWNHSSQDVVQPVNHQTEENRVVLVVNGVYVAPGYRQGGTGTNTLAASIGEGLRMARSRGLSGVQFQVRVNEDNASAVKLYERAGFERVETERLVMGEKERNGVKIPPREVKILVMHRHTSL